MAVVPVIFSGVFYPKNKKDPPMPGTFLGNAAIYGLEVGGGPVIPPDPPVHIWGGGNEPFPTPPIFWPGFPHWPPEGGAPPDVSEPPTVVKPPPEDGGWGYANPPGVWFFVPGAATPGPKK